jgi:hypothetical protein
MKRLTRSFIVLGLGLFAFTGCNAYRLQPPAGFAQVSADQTGAHLKAGDDAGLSVKVYENVKGGTLAFWSEDLVRKLGKRGYTLVGQKAVKSKNGKPGTQFDFAYHPKGGEPKFYSAAVFVTDKHRVVIQLAGDEPLSPKYRPQVETIAKSTKVRGCRAWTDICDGPQPGPLQTPPPDPEHAPAVTETLAEQSAPSDESPAEAG